MRELSEKTCLSIGHGRPGARRIGLAGLASLAFTLMLATPMAAFAETWFYITGDTENADAETVQVAPDTVVVLANQRVMNVRTSRTISRNGYDGLPYRSYISTVKIDCDRQQAGFSKLVLFEGPLWTGPSRVNEYGDADMPRMRFLDMQPNPTERIVQAACVVGRVQTR